MFNPPHPGEILKELYIEPLHLSVTEVAKSIGVTRKTLSSIVNEKSGISSEMALRLSKAFENSNPEYWLNLQQQYDLWHAQQKLDVTHIRILLSNTSNENNYHVDH